MWFSFSEKQAVMAVLLSANQGSVEADLVAFPR